MMDAKFLDSIKTKYQERRVNYEKQWPRCNSSKLVKLELVQREKLESYSANRQRGRRDSTTKRTPLAYCDLFKVKEGEKKVRKVLVEGDAGIGKTTFTISISEEWANGKLFQEFELLLLLPLREKKVASAKSLSKLLKSLHPSPRVCESVATSIQDGDGKKVLIIADGWDEVGESQRDEESFLYQLLFKDFSLMSVVVTSRPSASVSFHSLPFIDRFVEINGFSEEDIEKYIQSEVSRDPDHLLHQLEMNPLINSVCSVPLNCAIVCHLWHNCEATLPSTMTELYTKIILTVIRHEIQKNGACKHLATFADLPEELKPSWWLLCKFAFETLKSDKIVFSEQELATVFPQGLDEKIFCFGLLQSSETILKTGDGKSFFFIHLTFQEYLAGLHLARQLADQQSQASAKQNLSVIVKEVLCSNNELERFSVVWRFFFGTYFNVIRRNDSHVIQPYISYYAHKNVVLYHCAFEGNNVANTRAIIDAADNIGVIHNLHTAHDCAAALYVIKNMEKCDNLVLGFAYSGLKEEQLRLLTDTLASKGGRLHITEVNVSGNSVSYPSVIELITLALRAPGYLEGLWISDVDLGDVGVELLIEAIHNGYLPNLLNLFLEGCLTSDADTNSRLLLSLGEALFTHCARLKSLDFSRNNLGVPGATALARVISEYNRTCSDELGIVVMYLQETKFGDEGLCAFVEELQTLMILIYLDLRNNSITGTGVSYLADAVISKKKIVFVSDYLIYPEYPSEINLDHNSLGLEGVLAVGKIISSVNLDGKQFYLSLRGCQLTTNLVYHDWIECEKIEDIGRQLHQLPQSKTVWNLTLDDNNFTGEGVHILVGFLHLCSQLGRLDTSNCEITSDDLNRILDSLVQYRDAPFSNLKYWDLRDNKIDDDGVDALIGHLPHLFLRDVDAEDLDWCGPMLDGNPVGPKMMLRMTEAKMRHYKSSVNSSSEGEQLSETNSTISDEEQSGENSSVTSDREEVGESSSSPSEEEQPISLVLPSSPGVINTHEEEQIQNPPTSESLCVGNRMRTSRSTNNYQSGGGEESSGSATSEESDTDLQPPPAKKQRWCDLPGVEPCHLALIEWKDENGASKKLNIYSEIAHKWKKIATLLGFKFGEIESIQENIPCDTYNRNRVTCVLARWFEDARSLPNARKYPKSWDGLIELLKDAELGEVAEELQTALSSTHHSVKGNLQ